MPEIFEKMFDKLLKPPSKNEGGFVLSTAPPLRVSKPKALLQYGFSGFVSMQKALVKASVLCK